MLNYDIDPRGSKEAVVNLTGTIDENSGKILADLHSKLSAITTCHFDFLGVEAINSLGIRTWINFLRSFEEGRSLLFEECTPDVVNQINMIPRFLGGAAVTSFHARYYCPDCDYEQQQRFDVSQGYDAIVESSQNLQCDSCKVPLELEGDEDVYFDFLRKAAKTA